MALRRGSKGQDVRQVQERLIALGFLDDVADGDFGPKTEAAVKAFQGSRGLGVDGVVGPQTSAALSSGGSTPRPSPGAPASGTGFVAVAVENPGGGRITDKTEPRAADLVIVAGHGGRQVRIHRLAAQAWDALTQAARAAGIQAPYLEPMSGYRSVAEQERSWQRALERYGSEAEARRWVAKPGGSPHHSGRAIDCYLGSSISSSNVDAQRRTEAWRWLDQHAEEFGFYPYPVEPWHWEYNPSASGR